MKDSSGDALRVDQVGSLLRPPWLAEAFRREESGEAAKGELEAAQDRSIREVVARQEALGFPVVTDGEHRRRHFMESFGESVSGFSGPNPMRDRRPVKERLRQVRNVPLEELRFLKTIAKSTAKVSLIGPDRIAEKFAWEDSRAVYGGLDDFVADVVAIERRMVSELVAEGCTYVHIDAPSYTRYLDPFTVAPMLERGESLEQNLERSIAADNAIIDGHPGVTFGIHLCRGGKPGAHRRSGSYEAIAERLFNGLAHDRLLLEYDNERSGGFEPLRFVPKGKIAVLGLVTTKAGELESEETLKRRIDEAAKFLPLDQLALSPACGFGGGGSQPMRRMTDEEQWRKLERVLKVARDVWG